MSYVRYRMVRPPHKRRSVFASKSQRKVAVPRREPRATGPVEFFGRSRMIGDAFLKRNTAPKRKRPTRIILPWRESCGGYRPKKLEGSPSARPRRRPAAALLLPADAPLLSHCCFAAASPLSPPTSNQSSTKELWLFNLTNCAVIYQILARDTSLFA